MVDELDIGRLKRLRAAIVGSAGIEASFPAASALYEAAIRYQEAVPEALTADLQAEFAVLFVKTKLPAPTGGYDPRQTVSAAHRARERLLAMAGWLDTVITAHA